MLHLTRKLHYFTQSTNFFACLLQNSSCIATVSSQGRLLIYAVKQVVESQPLHASFDMPDWIERPDIQYEVRVRWKRIDSECNTNDDIVCAAFPPSPKALTANVNAECDGQESDAENWMEPRKALLKPYPPVILQSSITAMCAGNFGRGILVGTRCGMVAKISWLGEVLQLFSLTDSLPEPLSLRRMASDACVFGDSSSWESSRDRDCTLTGFGIKSMTFNNSLQLLAMVRAQGPKEHGSLCLGVLCGDMCFIRDVTITENEATVKAVKPRQKDRKGFKKESALMPHESESLSSAVSVTNVSFSATSSLLGVCLSDGTILVSRVEHYRTGTRSERRLSLHRRMSSESYKFSVSDSDFDLKAEDEATQSLRESRMDRLWGYEVQHLLCLNHSNDNLHGLPQCPDSTWVPVSSLCFSPDASAVAVAQGASLIIWSTVNGKKLSNTSSNDEMLREDPLCDPKAAVQPENRPFCSLSWGYYGYRIIAAPDDFECSEDSGSSSSDTVIVAFDILSTATSELSSSQLCFRSYDRVIILDTLPWEPKMRYWLTLPVHQGYITANGPVKYVSTSPSGAHIAVAGSNGFVLFSRARRRWLLFSSIQQEREMVASGMCWWGEEAVFIICRQASGYMLHLYPRYHLSANSELLKPLRLPHGLKPSFMSCITEGHGESVWLLIGGLRDCFVCQFRARTSLLKAHGTHSAYLCSSYEVTLPHVLDDGAPHELPRSSDVGAPRRMFLVPHVSPPLVAILDYCGTLAVMKLPSERRASRSSVASFAPEETPTPTQLSFSGRNPIEVIKRGVVSIVDLSSLFNGKLIGTNNHLDALCPCYLLHYSDVDVDDQFVSNNNCLRGTLWCPALNLKPLTQHSRNTQPVLGSDEGVVSPQSSLNLGHEQEGFVSAFRHLVGDLNMGLVPSLGCTVHVSQTMYTSNTEPTRFELRTVTYPSLCILLRHLVVLGRLQQQRSGQEIPSTHSGRDASMIRRLALHICSGVEESSPSNTILQEMLPSDAFSIAALLIRRLLITYPGCIPETLELLLRHELEELRSHSRQRRKETSQFKKEDMTYWPYFDTVRLSQVAPECFLEVLARVARKVEPELASFLFPIHLITAPSKLLLGNIGIENITDDHGIVAYPPHLVHECILVNRLKTATWYLTLIRDDIILGLVEAGNVEGLVGKVIPPEMYPLTILSGRKGWCHGLSHALSCCLFLLAMEQGTTSDERVLRLLPEIWLFARKRERSPGVSTPTPTERKKPSLSPDPAIQQVERTTSPLRKSESSRSSGWLEWLWGSSTNIMPPTNPVTPLRSIRASRPINGETAAAAAPHGLSAEEFNNNDDFVCSSSDASPFRKNSMRELIVADPKLFDAIDRTRELYSMSPSCAADVLRRFLWNKLASSNIIAAMTVFSSLTQGEISEDAGIDKSEVLSSLRQSPMPADHRSPAGSEDSSLMDMFLSYARACRLTPREAVMVSAGSEGMLMLEQLWCVSKALHHCGYMLVCALLLGKTTALSSTLANSPPRVKGGYPVFLLAMKSCIEAGTEMEDSILDDTIARRLASLLQLGSGVTLTVA